jgi:TorA maturation chaperone TorD
MTLDQQALYDARLELVDFLIEAFHDTPDEAFVARLLDGELDTPGESVNDDLDAGFDHLREFVAENEDRDPEAVADELAKEYTSLFVGPRPPIMAHETYYREGVDFLGSGLAEVEATFSAAGWGAPEDVGHESDFVSVELLFLRDVIGRQRAGKEEAVGFERVFLDEHLSTWVDEMLADLADETDEPFYLAAGRLLRGLVDLERDLVA